MLKQNRSVAGRCVAAACAFALCPSLFAQAPTVQAVELARGVGVYVPPANAAADQNAPIPFPIDENTVLDLMPRPQDVPPAGSASANGDLMQIFDASTGKTWQIPGLSLGNVRASDVYPGQLGADGQDAAPLDPYADRTWNGPMTRILDTSVAPFRQTCKVFMLVVSQDGTQSGWFRCTGSLIDAKTVLTAGHCVYTRQAAFTPNGPLVDVYSYVREIYVVPGWAGVGDVPLSNPDVQNYGYAHSTSYTTTTGWINDGNYDYDVGVITLDRPVGMLTGWYGLAWGGSCGDIQQRTYNYSGFPSQICNQDRTLHNGRDMYFFSAQVDSCPGNQLHFNTTAGCFTAAWGGMSGGPLYYQSGASRLVHAVASNSDRNVSGNWAKLTPNEGDQIINAIIPNGRGNTFDLAALDTNFSSTTVPAGTPVTGNFLATNATNANGNGTFTFRVYLSANNLIGPGDTLLSTQQFTTTFGPMSSTYATIPAISIPANTPPGTYYLGVEFDSNTDSNPFNNATNTWDATRIQVTPNLVYNDSCVGAPAAALGTYTGTTAQATTDGSGNCNSSSKDVWFSFVAPASGLLSLNTCGSDFDTMLSVHTGCPGTVANIIACNDDSGNGGPCGAAGFYQSALTANVVRGGQYFIRVAGYNSNSGNYVLNLSMLPPANDHCDNATLLQPNSVASGSTDLADTDGGAPCGYSANAPDVWYMIQPAGDCIARLYTCGSNYDTVLSVHTGCPGTLDNSIDCNDDVANHYCGPGIGYYNSFVAPAVVGGQSYTIRVAGYNGNHGDFQLHYDLLAPVNDSCYNPNPLHTGANPFGNLYASTDGPEEHFLGFCCGDYQVNNDMWYTWRSPCNGITTIDTAGANFDTKIAVYTQQCQFVPNQAIAGNDDYFGTASRVQFHSIAGTVYQVRVGGYQQNRGTGNINVGFQRDCIADVDDGSDSGLPDCGVTIDDLLYFLHIFEEGVIGADVDDGSSTGTPDGGVTIDDLLYYLTRFEAGC